MTLSPGLAVSRAIGNQDARPLGVNEIPDVQIVKLDKMRSTFRLIMGTKGLWLAYPQSALQIAKDINLMK